LESSEVEDWIERRNAENWIHQNPKIVEAIYRKWVGSGELYKIANAEITLSFHKMLQRGIAFDVIRCAWSSNSKWNRYTLTEKGSEIYEEIKKQS